MLTGPDVSHHKGTVDWGRVASAGHDFGISKATDGTSYGYTGYYRDQIPRIVDAGLIPGAYHWLQAGPNGEQRNPRAQARYFVDVTDGCRDQFAAVDVELQRTPAGVVVSKPRGDSVDEFADEWYQLVPGHTLVTYTGSWYWKSLIGNPNGAHNGPLWHSEYEATQAEINDGPELDGYGGWASALMWQYTSSATVPGISGAVDMNVFYGDRAQLLALTRPQEDPMAKLDDDDRKWLAEQLGKTAAVLATGVTNKLANPKLPGWGWVGQHPASLASVLAAVKGIDIDEVAVAAQIAPAVVAKLTPETIAAILATSLAPIEAEAVVQLLGEKLTAKPAS